MTMARMLAFSFEDKGMIEVGEKTMEWGENSKRSATMTKKKDVLTTGQVAKICNVAPRTVSKWFDTGQLRGYRIPGSKDRRIPLDQLIRFMRAHGIPLNGLDGGATRVLLVDNDRELTTTLSDAMAKENRFEVRVAECGFDAGILAEQFRPHIILLDIMLEDINFKRISTIIRENPELQGTRVVAIASGLTEGETQALLQQGFDSVLLRPFDLRKLIQCIDEAMSIIH
jgi:excisionase family DNA binding protein